MLCAMIASFLSLLPWSTTPLGAAATCAAMPAVLLPTPAILGALNTMTELDKAWADIYWTFDENAFDLSDDHIGIYTEPVPFSNAKYFDTYAEVPF